jgi:hypothetical protein
MPSRQVLYPPFGVGQQYKLFHGMISDHPGTLVTYVEPIPNTTDKHRFQSNNGGIIDLKIGGPTYGNYDYIGLATNSGGRRKSRRSKQSKRSHRKTKRRH